MNRNNALLRRLRMKKKLVSLIAAAALIGLASIAKAGILTTKGNTNITIGGFIETYFDWTNNQGFLATVANPKYYYDSNKGAVKSNPAAQTSFGTTANHSRLDLALDNKAEGIKGLIEGDFYGGGANIGTDGHGNFRLRHAYVVNEFCQEGCNYTPWLLVGQTWNAGFYYPYSLNTINNMAGSSGGPKTRIPQIGFGVRFDLGSVKLNPQIFAEDLSSFTNNNSLPDISSGVANPNNLKTRYTMPGLGVKVPVEFNTGLGAPAKFYADFQWQNVKLTNANKNINSDNQNSYEFGGGIILPVYFVSLKADANYSKGFTKYASLTSYTPPSYYLNGTSIEKVSATSWDAMLKIKLNKLIQVPFTLAGGYGQTVFGNYTLLKGLDTPYVRKASTLFANVEYNLTKSLSFGLEYDRNKTYYIGAGNDPNDGRVSNQVFLRGIYYF